MKDMTQLESMIYANLYAKGICDGVRTEKAMADAESAIGKLRRITTAREEMPDTPIVDGASLIKAMIEARMRLASLETLPIDAGWCLHERQYRMLAEAGATINDSGKGETFRGEPIAVRSFGGYVFNRNTGSRMSIEGEQ
jgi:hypothetical protein